MLNNAKTHISELKNNVGNEVTLAGWLYQSRASGKIQFVIIRDGTGLCQCVVEKGKIPDELFETLGHLGRESSLTVTGTVRDRDSMDQVRVSTDQLKSYLRDKLNV
jgi:asparaginyl-tRNA synthetase